MPMKRENIALAKAVLNGESLAAAAGRRGLTRGRAWQIVRAFCLEFMLCHERNDSEGKLKNLKSLREAWRRWARV